MTPTNSDSDDDNVPNVRSSLRLRLVIAILFVIAAVTLYLTNSILMERFSQSTANRAELRLALYGGNLKSELQRNSIVPQLLARRSAGRPRKKSTNLLMKIRQTIPPKIPQEPRLIHYWWAYPYKPVISTY